MSYFDADFEQVKDTTPRQLELAECQLEPVIFNTDELLNIAAFRAQCACVYEWCGLKQDAVRVIDDAMRHMRRAREFLMKDLEG